jgi:hypothetical protein
MGDLQQFFDADAGVPQHLDCGPGPERPVLFGGQVAALAAGRVIGPGSRGAGTCDSRADQGLAGGSEGLAGFGQPGRPQQFRGGLAVRVHGGDQDRQDRQPFTGPRVDPRLALPGGLALADLLRADRTRDDPPGPACRVVDCPLGQIQVEGPDRCQALPVTDPLSGDLRLPAAGGGDGLAGGAQPLFPRLGDPGREVQAVDAGVVVLQVFPESAAQGSCQRPQAAVVEGWLAFFEVLDQQVAYGPAAEAVAVDQLLGCPLASSAKFPQHWRRSRFEYPGPVQHLVEPRRVRHGAGMGVFLGGHQLQDVTGGDVAEYPALGAHDHRCPVHDVGLGVDGHLLARAGPGETSESRRVACRAHAGSQGAAPHHRRGEPRQ